MRPISAISSAVAFRAARAASAGSSIRRTSSSSLTISRLRVRMLASGTTSASVERSRTTVPCPWRGSRIPITSSVRTASRMELRPTPSFTASSRSGGSRSPGFSWPLEISRRICSATCSYRRTFRTVSKLGAELEPLFGGIGLV